MQFGIPYTLLEIPDSSGVISFAINEKRKFLACLTEKSIQLYDNSSYFPILITNLTQFFESIDIKGKDPWIKWMTDNDLAFGTNDGMVYISHVFISERKQPIHDYDNDFYKKYLNKYEFVKILAPIQISVFNQSPNSDMRPYVTSAFSAYDHICICTSESKIIYISKDAVITHSTQLFTKPDCIINADYYPPASLFCTYDSSPHFINFDLQSFENKKQPIIDKLPINHPTLLSINYQQTYLAVYKQRKGYIRIFQLGLPEWKPPIVVYASHSKDSTENYSQQFPQYYTDSINDPVIHIFWNSKGNSLIIIHRSGKTAYFFIETKTLHKSSIDYFCKQYQQQKEQQEQQQNKEDTNEKDTPNPTEPTDSKSSESTYSQKIVTNEIPYKFLFDRYGERLFVSNGKSIVFISFLENHNFFLTTSTWIFDLRRNLNLYSGTSLYPIKDVSFDFNNEIILVSNDKGIQLIDSNNAKIVSDFMPVVSETNKKNRRLLDAHFIGNSIFVVVGPIDYLCDDKFELNFCENQIDDKSNKFDCDNEFYRQFDSVYLYDQLNQKNVKEKEVVSIDDGNEFRSIILLFSVNKIKDDKYELKPDLLVKSFFIPKFFDFIEDHGIISDEKNIAYIYIMNKLTNPARVNTYFLTKSKKILSIHVHTIKENVKVQAIAMSTQSAARFLLSDNIIHDEQLKPFGENVFVTKDNTPIFYDNLLSTKTPPIVFYLHNTRTIEGKSYKSAFYKELPIFSFNDNFLRVIEIPFAFDGMIFYILPEDMIFGKFKFKFLNIGQHILMEAIKDYRFTTYLINIIYRKFNQIPVVAVETFKEALQVDFLPQFIAILFPHLNLNEVAQIIQFLPTRCDRSTFSKIFDSIFKYISYSNKYLTDNNKNYLEAIINNHKFSSKIISLEWNQLLSLIDKNIRNQIFLNISPNSFVGLISEMNSEHTHKDDSKSSETTNDLIFNDDLIQFLIEKGEIIRAYSISHKENSTHFCELFRKTCMKNENQENFFNALNLMEKEKNQWKSNDKIYPIVFHFIGCLFQAENLSLFSAATFIVINESQKFMAVIISDESVKISIDKYLNDNPDGIYVNEIREAFESVNK